MLVEGMWRKWLGRFQRSWYKEGVHTLIDIVCPLTASLRACVSATVILFQLKPALLYYCKKYQDTETITYNHLRLQHVSLRNHVISVCIKHKHDNDPCCVRPPYCSSSAWICLVLAPVPAARMFRGYWEWYPPHPSVTCTNQDLFLVFCLFLLSSSVSSHMIKVSQFPASTMLTRYVLDVA